MHQTSSTCHTDTTHVVEYGVSHPLTPSSSPVTTVLYCTVLYCTVLYCTVLYCTVLYCTAQKYRRKKEKEKKKKRKKGKYKMTKKNTKKDKKDKKTKKTKKNTKKYKKDKMKDKKGKKCNKKGKNTERQKDKITPTWQGARRAPKPSTGARTRESQAPEVLVCHNHNMYYHGKRHTNYCYNWLNFFYYYFLGMEN